MGETFWTYFLGTIGLVVLVYIVVMTPVHMVRNARARRAVVDEPVQRVVPDDEHVAFPDPPPAPVLTVIRGGLDLS